MSIANAAHCSMMGGANKPQMFSLSHSGTSPLGFYAQSLGTLPLSQTFSCWYRYIYPNEDLDSSRVVFKYGNSSNGCAFGSVRYSLLYSSSCAGLCEARYWIPFNRFSGRRLADTGWLHLAFLIKSGSSPLVNAVYINGEVQTKVDGSGTQSYITPSGKFSICGRDGEFMNATVQVFQPRIYNELLNSAAILEDMATIGKPSRSTLTHYWDGTLLGDKVQDHVGSWDLSFSTGCEILPVAPEF